MSDATKVARLVRRAGEDAAWLDALAVSLTDSKRYVIAAACRVRARGLEEFVRSLVAEELETSPESATDYATRTIGGTS